MNCKPGDLAVIVSTTDPRNRNRIVEILNSSTTVKGYFCWLVRCPTPLHASRLDGTGRFQMSELFVPDAWMRPINRPPDGSDAPEHAPLEAEHA